MFLHCSINGAFPTGVKPVAVLEVAVRGVKWFSVKIKPGASEADCVDDGALDALLTAEEAENA
eukprot:scaffold670054_cov83-Prasinocladus_malaysianus.AAC.1